MKRVFKFKKGLNWEYDNELTDFIVSYLNEQNCPDPRIRKNFKVTVIIENDN